MPLPLIVRAMTNTAAATAPSPNGRAPRRRLVRRRAIDDMRGYLPRIFRDTEEENRRSILDALTVRGGALLDIGTHTGEFTSRIVERVRPESATGIELVEEYAEIARARGLDIVEADADGGLPFADGSFDTVVANQVVEHVRWTDSLLAEIRRVLAPGGVSCISTNNLSSWHNLASLALGYQPMPMHVSDQVVIGNPLTPDEGADHPNGAQAHLRVFTPRALVDLAARHGLRAHRVWGVGYYPLPPLLARAATKVDRLHAAYTCALLHPDPVTVTDSAIHDELER